MGDTRHNGADLTPATPALLKRVPFAARAGLYYLAFLAFILILVPALAHMLGARFLSWHVEIGWGRAVGWTIFAAAYVLYTYASIVLMRQGRGPYVEFDPPKEFVVTGPFRWSRNPIAASLLAMLLGEALAFSSTGIFVLFLAGVPLAHVQVICLEEPTLKKRFGPPYQEYVTRVPRWFPRPPRKGSP
jgi:protein-S-isoprenylcysteine O-methyltransferase Ste14